MRKSLLVSAALAGLGVAAVSQGAAAAPFALAGSSLTVSADDGLFEQIYYHQGRYFPYRYNSGYYAHRIYRHGHSYYY